MSGMPPMQRHLFEMHARLPVYRRHVERAQAIVAKALEQMEHPYSATSGGKDSCVTSHLVWQQRTSVPGVYFDADCSFPETDELLDRLAEEHTIIRWKCEPLLDTFARLGGPTAKGIERATMESTVYAPIRALLAEHHFDGVFLGLRAEESSGREKNAQFRGPIYRYKRDGVLACTPVAHMSRNDIWAYIVENNLDYNRAYDKMWDLPERQQRVSYWAGETSMTYGRFVILRRFWPELFNRYAERFPEVRRFV